jgi:ferritin-like metal-binding protein YciE
VHLKHIFLRVGLYKVLELILLILPIKLLNDIVSICDNVIKKMALEEQNPMSNNKLLQYLNEILSVENAAIERLQSRIQETSLEDIKDKLHHHLQETINQQQRLSSLIKNRGGRATSAKADLPILNPKTETTSRVDEMISTATTTDKQNEEALKSIVNETENVRMKSEKELIEIKQDAIIENAEIVSYKMLIEIAKKVGANDAIPIFEQNLKEKESMAEQIIINAPKTLNQLWPYIESSAGSRSMDA